MQFWDINPQTKVYSLRPQKYTFIEFQKPLIEVNLFCEIFGFIILTLVAVEDLSKRGSQRE